MSNGVLRMNQSSKKPKVTGQPASVPVPKLQKKSRQPVPLLATAIPVVASEVPERIPPIPPLVVEKALPKPEPVEQPETKPEIISTEIRGTDLLITLEPRIYRVRGWDKPLSPQILKVNLQVSQEDRFYVDTLDLYQAKARTAFIRHASIELGTSEECLKRDLGKVLRKVEAIQAEQLAATLAAKDQRPPMTEAEHAEALALLQAPDLRTRILNDFKAMGVVGEESNKLTCYLAAVSRLLDRPLALLIQSASAAGKSSLMDAVLDLLPEEDVSRYSAMSSQSLFYMGNRNLKHKVLAIAEEEGAQQAAYALKLLQSEGKVTMASTGKDAATGMLVTHDYQVEGPVGLFLTTTAIDLDEELLNRCLVLTVNESREQTRAIHATQRSRETLEGMLAKTTREKVRTQHRNAQRLLQPLAVVNPYAEQLRFRDDQTRSRRDHMKYLTLIRSITLLNQFQREVKTIHHEGQDLQYLEVTPQDIALANELAQEVLGQSMDELLPQTRILLEKLLTWVKEECLKNDKLQTNFHFNRRKLREVEAIELKDTQLKVHLARLVDMELLLVHRGKQGKTYEYELLYNGKDAHGRAKLLGLIEGIQLQPVAMLGTSRGERVTFAESGRCLVGAQSHEGRSAEIAMNGSPDKAFSDSHFSDLQTARQGVSTLPSMSHPQGCPPRSQEVR